MSDRQIDVPAIDWDEVQGIFALVPVKVDWPELQLAEGQMIANAVAVATCRPAPFPDRSFITLRIERPGAWR